jgi:hypothetical protein
MEQQTTMLVPPELDQYFERFGNALMRNYEDPPFWVSGSEVPIPLPSGWTQVVVDSYGGEGQGDTYYTVRKFTNGDDVLYVRFNGWYSSYDGADYNNYQVVRPVEKTIVVYE